MKTRIISRTVVLPAGKQEVFDYLKKTDTLSYIAQPFASFKRVPIEDKQEYAGPVPVKDTAEHAGSEQADVPADQAEPFPAGVSNDDCWQEGADYAFFLKIFGRIPIGLHRVHVLHFDEEEISTLEGNRRVPVWNHRIILTPISDQSCEYTDELEIGAGPMTGAVCLWADAFLKHRQKRWIELINSRADKKHGR